MKVLMILLVSVYYCSSVIGVAAKKDLHFSFITALSGGSTSSGGIPIIDYALEQINNDTRVLPDYNLRHTTVLDSEVNMNAKFAYAVIITHRGRCSFINIFTFAVQKHLCS